MSVELQPGDGVGRYVLLRPLAHGGMGIVYLAFDPELDRNVALKLLLPRRLDRPDEREALIGEARALAKLSHPNVVQVYDVGAWGEQVYVALEYLVGANLVEWQRAGGRHWSELLEVLLAAGRGIAAAHTAGIVHCDIKPSNILVGDDGVARVLDFGLARGVAAESTESSPRTSSTGERARARVVGTIGYIAPEQFLDAAADARSDQFGFCVTAWEALLGTRPYPGRTRGEYERAVLSGVAPSAAVTQVPTRVLDVLRRGLARNPDARYADMGELLAALAGRRSPWIRRPSVLAASAGAIVALGLGLRAHLDPTPTCDHGAEQIASSWNDVRRTAIAAAFTASDTPYAAIAWSNVELGVDRWTQAWADSYDEVCAATHLRREQPELALERANACLGERRAELDAMVALFEHPDREVIEHAAVAARSLRPPDRCRVPVYGERQVQGEDARARAVGLGQQLAQARAWLATGHLDDAFEAARALAEEARSEGLPQLRADACLLASRAAARGERVAVAVEYLDRALLDAEEAGDDRLRAEVLTELVYVAGHQGKQPQHAHWLARTADEVITRVDDASELRGTLHANEAMVDVDQGEHTAALAGFHRALAVHDAHGRGPDDELARIFVELGAVHHAIGEHARAAGWLTQAHAMRVALAGPDHPDVADSLVGQGKVLLALGAREAAFAHHQRALDVLERARGPHDASLRTVLGELAVALRELGRYDEALSALRRSLALWVAIDPRSAEVGTVHAELGEIQLRRHDFVAAQGELEQALELLRTALPPEHPRVANAVAALARARLAGATASP